MTHPLVRLYWRVFKPKTYGSRAILFNQGKILLAKNINSRHWSLPGGRIDKGETPEKCLLRELKEELCLSGIKIDHKLGEYVSNKEGKKDTVHIFVINLETQEFDKQWELEEAKWFSLDNLPENTSPATKRRIEEFIGQKRDIVSYW